VLLVLQPRPDGFNAWGLVCLGSTVLLAVRDFTTRRVHVAIPSIILTFATTVTVTLLAGALTLQAGWVLFDVFQVGLLGLTALFFSAAYFLITRSTRRGEL